MEPAELPPMQKLKEKPPAWSAYGAKDREPNILTSIYIDPPDEEVTNIRLVKRWMEIEKNEVLYDEYEYFKKAGDPLFFYPFVERKTYINRFNVDLDIFYNPD